MNKIIIRNEEELKFSCTRGLFFSFSDIEKFLNTGKIKNLNYKGNDISMEIKGVSITIVDYKKVLLDTSLVGLNKNIKKLVNKKHPKEFLNKYFKKTALTIFLTGILSVTPGFTPKTEQLKSEPLDLQMDDNTTQISEIIEINEPIIPEVGYDILAHKPISRGVAMRTEKVIVPEKNQYELIKEAYPIFDSIISSFGLDFNSSIDYLIENKVDYNDMASVLKSLYDFSFNSSEIVTEELTFNEIESKILNYAELLGINDDEYLITVLAIFRFETGYGTSFLATTKNNYGGHLRVNGEGLSYNTPDIGAYRQIMVVNYNYQLALSRGYDYSKSIEDNIEQTYCTDGSDWSFKIASIKEEVRLDYMNYFSNKGLTYVKNNYSTN